MEKVHFKARGFPLEIDLKPYFKTLNRIISLDLHSLDDKGLKNKAAWLKQQAAVEEKENIRFKSEGSILGSVTLQHFFRLYQRLCGMTATARTSAEEFKEFYGLSVVVVLPNCPVEESEHLAWALKEASITCQVLNAKNDEKEAKIIARAGAVGAVTVSTSCEGRQGAREIRGHRVIYFAGR